MDRSLILVPLCSVSNSSHSVLGLRIEWHIWATSWENQQMSSAHSEDSDQHRHPPNLIRVFTVHMKKAWVLNYPLSTQRRLWSDWAEAQADLSLRWAHSRFIGFVMRWLIFCCFVCSVKNVVSGKCSFITRILITNLPEVVVILVHVYLSDVIQKGHLLHMSHVMSKPVYAICE